MRSLSAAEGLLPVKRIRMSELFGVKGQPRASAAWCHFHQCFQWAVDKNKSTAIATFYDDDDEFLSEEAPERGLAVSCGPSLNSLPCTCVYAGSRETARVLIVCFFYRALHQGDALVAALKPL